MYKEPSSSIYLYMHVPTQHIIISPTKRHFSMPHVNRIIHSPFIHLFSPKASLSRQPRPPHDPHLDSLQCIQLRPNIEIEARRSSRAAGSPSVEIDDIVDAGAAAVDDPVVPVKGRRVAEDGIDAGGWGHAGAFVGEGGESGAVASVVFFG